MFSKLAASAIATGYVAATAQTGSSANPGPFIGETWYSGLVDIDHEDNASDDIFFWWFESRGSPKDDPIVLWLTGGPGCASEIALFEENGPYQFESDGKTLKSNPYSWNQNANLIYVDQPVGTGFSHANPAHLVTNEDEVGENMAQFLIKFLELYPQLQGKDFFITGESYAGHYIPAISHNLAFKNKDNLKAQFKGMAIGNGLVDPFTQYPEYDTFALENKLIGKVESDILAGGFKACQAIIETGVWIAALEFCQINVEVILGNPIKPRFNVYDIREGCDKPPLCYDFSPADNLLGMDSTLEVLGIQGRKWTECNSLVHTALLGDWMLNLAPKVTDLLNADYDVLVYSGDKDFICNWRGGEAWTHKVDWNSQAEFQAADYADWNVSGKAAGALKSVKNLKFLRVFEAGHMVPMNQPEAALQMLTELITPSGPLESNQFIN